MNHAFRLSRIRAPRGTLAATLLVAAVFIAFGLVVAALGETGSTVVEHRQLDAPPFAQWLSGRF